MPQLDAKIVELQPLIQSLGIRLKAEDPKCCLALCSLKGALSILKCS